MASKKYERHFVQHNYHDHSQETPSCKEVNDILIVSSQNGRYDSEALSGATTKGRRCVPGIKFPQKLHELLENSEADGLSDVISWKIHGRAFSVNNLTEFSDSVMPLHFNQTKITSFFRQLNLYGFLRITQGRDRGAYYHELFLRGKPFLTTRIMRQKVKGTRVKGVPSPETEPDFYSMPYVMGSLSLPTLNISAPPTVGSDDLVLPKPSSALSASSSTLIFVPEDFGLGSPNLYHPAQAKNVSHSSEASVGEKSPNLNHPAHSKNVSHSSEASVGGNSFSSLQTGSNFFPHNKDDLDKLFFESSSCENSTSDFSFFDSCFMQQEPDKPFGLLNSKCAFAFESKFAVDDVSLLDEDDLLNDSVQYFSMQECEVLHTVIKMLQN
jgi:hypothetical protein